jgi:endonuclease/exonuclease/phosphatase family metal-dependent hydrolase
MPKLKILSINVNSVVNLRRRYYLNEILKDMKPDIVLLCETHLKNKHKLSFENYKMVRKDRATDLKGGCAILIKEVIRYKMINITHLENMECCAIEIEDKNSKESLVMASIYNRSGAVDIKNDLNKIVNQIGHKKLVIGGDFNAKHRSWNDVHQTKSGQALRDWLDNEGLSLNINHLPTALPTRGDSYLNHILASAELNVIYNRRHHLLLESFPTFSDHDGIILEIGDREVTAEMIRKIKDFKNTNIPEFQRKIKEEIDGINLECNRNLTNEEIVEALDKLNSIIINTIEDTVPTIQLKEHGLINLDELTLKLIKLKKTLRRRLHRTRDLLLKPIIRNLDTLIQQQISDTYNKYWEKKMKSIQMNKDTFKQIKNLVGANCKPKMPSLKINNQEIEGDEDKANELAKHWEGVFQTTFTTSEETIDMVNNTVLQIKEIDAPLFIFNTEANSLKNNNNVGGTYNEFMGMNDFNNILKSRNNKQSAGNDLLPLS